METASGNYRNSLSNSHTTKRSAMRKFHRDCETFRAIEHNCPSQRLLRHSALTWKNRTICHKGDKPLLNQLRQVDPESARRLHPADEKRILRALEVYRETGRTISEHNRETRVLPKKYRPLYIGLAYRDRSDLRAAIDQRVDRMVASGLLEEVRSLAERGVPESATAMQAIGYKELVGVLRGERSLEEAAEEVKLRSRQYAKRQLTWLRRNENIFWILWEKNRDFARALQIATDFLHGQGLQ